MSPKNLVALMVFNLVLGASNVVIFVCWKIWEPNYSTGELSTNIAILQVMVTAAIMILAIINFMGFQTLQREANRTGKEAARDEVADLETRLTRMINEQLRDTRTTAKPDVMDQSQSDFDDLEPEEREHGNAD